jgi:hypothetical protein
MKIVSPFKDYYDYLVGVYGIDETIVYVRNTLAKGYVTTEKKVFDFHPFAIPPGYKTKYVVVNGRKYLFVCPSNSYLVKPKWELYDFDKHHGHEFISQRYFRRKDLEEQQKDYIGGTSQALIDLSKEVGAPVFSVTGFSWVERSKKTNRKYEYLLDDEVPMLSEYGFPNIIPANQLYQELEHYLCNVLRDSPDTKPPVTISDKDMIESKGFDKKISFRHRKNK